MKKCLQHLYSLKRLYKILQAFHMVEVGGVEPLFKTIKTTAIKAYIRYRVHFCVQFKIQLCNSSDHNFGIISAFPCHFTVSFSSPLHFATSFSLPVLALDFTLISPGTYHGASSSVLSAHPLA